MKIAIPVKEFKGLQSEISAHFGRAVGFILAEPDEEEIEQLKNTSEHMGGKGKPPELLDEADVDVVLCGNLGRRAVDYFNELGIEVCSGARGTAGDALAAWENDELEPATASGACQGHEH
ncbi:MAG: NifB/NifX family molybdenum-iron cluster-binding protein [bacterium]